MTLDFRMKKVIALIAFFAVLPLAQAQTAARQGSANAAAAGHAAAPPGPVVNRPGAASGASMLQPTLTGTAAVKSATGAITTGAAAPAGASPGATRPICRTAGAAVYYCL